MIADFGRWFKTQEPIPEPLPADAAERLEEMGLDLMKDGSVTGSCRCCGGTIKWTEYLTVNEILVKGVGEECCGKDERCCP